MLGFLTMRRCCVEVVLGAFHVLPIAGLALIAAAINDAADGYDRERRFMPPKSALCWLGQTKEVALLHEAMNSLGRALHKEGVAKG